MVWKMDMEYRNGQMVPYLQVNGNKTKVQVKEN